MKYQIVIEKTAGERYVAYCPLSAHFCAIGSDADAALKKLQEYFLCHLHDSSAEVEIVVFPSSVADCTRQNGIEAVRAQKGMQ